MGRRHWLAAIAAALDTPAGKAACRRSTSTDRRDSAELPAGRALSQVAYASRGLVLELAAIAAAGAHPRTGRSTMPGDAMLVAITGYSPRQVKHGLDALERIGALVKIREGKDRLTRDERLELHAQRSTARRFRAVYSCTLSSLLVSVGIKGFRGPRMRSKANTRGLRPSNDALAPLGPPPRKARRRSPTYAPAVHAVAAALRELGGVYRRMPYGGMLPALKRYALAGWQARHIDAEINDLNRRTGYAMPDAHPNWAAWLGSRLRHLDPADNPHLYDMAYARLADQAGRALDREQPCRHGQPDGLSTMNSGLARCPLCRAAQR